MLVPAMQSMGMCISSSTLSTPTCAPPLAPPPASTNPRRGRALDCVSWALESRGAAANIASARTSAARARQEVGNKVRIMPANLVFRAGQRHKHWGHNAHPFAHESSLGVIYRGEPAHPDDAAVPAHQVRAPELAAVLSHGGLLRALL